VRLHPPLRVRDARGNPPSAVQCFNEEAYAKYRLLLCFGTASFVGSFASRLFRCCYLGEHSEPPGLRGETRTWLRR
jgi:hypothetical protein